MTHTPEPWHTETFYEGGVAILCGTPNDISEHQVALATSLRGKRTADEAMANARRIVACVNAFAGIPIELIEAKVHGEYKLAIQRLDQYTVNGSLRARCERLEAALGAQGSERENGTWHQRECVGNDAICLPQCKLARAALAEGGV